MSEHIWYIFATSAQRKIRSQKTDFWHMATFLFSTEFKLSPSCCTCESLRFLKNQATVHLHHSLFIARWASFLIYATSCQGADGSGGWSPFQGLCSASWSSTQSQQWQLLKMRKYTLDRWMERQIMTKLTVFHFNFLSQHSRRQR